MEASSLLWRIVIEVDPRRKYSPLKELWRGNDLSDPEIPRAVTTAERQMRRPKLQVHNGMDWFDLTPPDPRIGTETFERAVQAIRDQMVSDIAKSMVFALYAMRIHSQGGYGQVP